MFFFFPAIRHREHTEQKHSTAGKMLAMQAHWEGPEPGRGPSLSSAWTHSTAREKGRSWGVAPISALLPKCCSTGLLTRPQHRAHSSSSLTSSYLLDKAVQDAVFCSIAEAAASCTSLLILFNRKKETGDQTIRARGSRMLESCS